MVLLAAVLFGTTGTAQALGPDGTDPPAVGAARVLLAALLLLLVARQVERGHARLPWPPAAVLFGGLGVAAYQLSFFEAVDRTGVAVGTVVALGSGPAFAGLAGRLANGEHLTRRWAGATALACAGVALLVGGGEGADVDAGGIALALVAGASYATYTVAAKGLLDGGHGPEGVMARFFALGALLLLPVLVVSGGGGLGSPGGLALVVYLAAIPTALAYVLFARGLRHLTSGETATLTLAEPLTATALGIVVLAERPSVLTALGAALVLAGLVVLAVRGRPAAPARLEVAR
jgi:DME family drug/metabolite transporter